MTLDVKGLSVSYGAVRAVFGVDLRVDDGEIVALVGANGAGKSSILGAIAGLLPRAGGELLLDGEPLPSTPPEVVARGMVLVPQGRKVFPRLTVEENLLLGGYRKGARWKIAEQLFEPIFEYFPRLAERRRQPAGRLSGGEQQMLVIGRGMLSQPKVMLVDEMSLGLAPKAVTTLFEMIVQVNRDKGTTFVLVEQAASVLNIASRAYLIQKGRVAFEGDADKLLSEVDVLRGAYLGRNSRQTTAPEPSRLSPGTRRG